MRPEAGFIPLQEFLQLAEVPDGVFEILIKQAFQGPKKISSRRLHDLDLVVRNQRVQ